MGFVLSERTGWLKNFLLRVEASLIATATEFDNDETLRVSDYLAQSKSAAEWANKILSPHSACYFTQTKVPDDNGPVRLLELVDHPNNLIQLTGHDFTVWRTPHPKYKTILNGIRRGSLGTTSENANFLPPNSDAYEHHTELITRSLDIIRSQLPSYYRFISTYLKSGTLVDRNASFRASTTYYARGMTFFSPLDSWTLFTWFEELIHEATHNFSFALMTFDSLMTGEDSFKLKIRGPFREDLRHLYGIFQALLVISRIMEAYKSLSIEHIEPKFVKNRMDYFLSNTSEQFELLKKEGNFTAIGKEIFENEIVPTFS